VWGKFQFEHMMLNTVINGHRFEWLPFPAVKGQPRMNPARFTQEFPKGRFICQEAGHVVAWIDGVRHDAFQVYPRRCIYGAWRVVCA
jgi:hypothetical protein